VSARLRQKEVAGERDVVGEAFGACAVVRVQGGGHERRVRVLFVKLLDKCRDGVAHSHAA